MPLKRPVNIFLCMKFGRRYDAPRKGESAMTDREPQTRPRGRPRVDRLRIVFSLDADLVHYISRWPSGTRSDRLSEIVRAHMESSVRRKIRDLTAILVDLSPLTTQFYEIELDDWIEIEKDLRAFCMEKGRPFISADIDRPNFLLLGIPIVAKATT